MAVPGFEPLALDLVRQCAAEAGLREIHFSHVSRCVSFLDDAGVRINVYFSTGKTSPVCLLACSLSSLAASLPCNAGCQASALFMRRSLLLSFDYIKFALHHTSRIPLSQLPWGYAFALSRNRIKTKRRRSSPLELCTALEDSSRGQLRSPSSNFCATSR